LLTSAAVFESPQAAMARGRANIIRSETFSMRAN
jgi:hypothetical protein